MYTHAMMIYLYTETPLHAGSGQSVATVDLPIQREVATNYPFIQASGIKGKLRAEADAKLGENNRKVTDVFGPAQKQMQNGNAAGNAYTGAISPGDAKLLLFPVRSLFGVFAWATSRALLARFARDYSAVGGAKTTWSIPAPTPEGEVLVAPSSDLVKQVNDHSKVVLEEFAYAAKSNDDVQKIGEWLAQHALPQGDEYRYWRNSLPSRLVILPEDDFRDYANLSTQIATRIKINNETKTVDKENGALWTEESIPAETLLYVPIFASNASKSSAENGLKLLKDDMKLKRIQFGGNETVGRGLTAVRYGGISNANV